MALSCAAYSKANEAKQIERMQKLGATNEELVLIRREYEHRRGLAATIWAYIKDTTKPLTYVGITERIKRGEYDTEIQNGTVQSDGAKHTPRQGVRRPTEISLEGDTE